MSSTPVVSVVMSVYNGEKYLRQSIESILNQTFTDFEFIIINDGSTDSTKDIVESYQDPRIVFSSRTNKGLVASLGEGIEKARGQYIARQDDDDISGKDRLKKTMEALKANPGVGLIGSARQNIDEAGNKLDIVTMPLSDADIRLYLHYHNPFCHGSIMFKKADYIVVGGYEEGFVPAEDYRLWAKLLEVTKGMNLADVLYTYRINPEGITSRQSNKADGVHRRIHNYILSRPDTILRGAKPHRAILLSIFIYGLIRLNIRSFTYPFRYIKKEYGLRNAFDRMIKKGKRVIHG